MLEAAGVTEPAAPPPPEVIDVSTLTPMMKQYLEVKASNPQALLFFRLGDFYELFFDDAVKAAELLQITLTSRAKGAERIPMCGVPYHAARRHIVELWVKADEANENYSLVAPSMSVHMGVGNAY